ncbi:MAG: hypothetical protein JW982_11370 [Spirochaetes bacterium]|nr:hypothetical protein [Spirochaetota bacterium]
MKNESRPAYKYPEKCFICLQKPDGQINRTLRQTGTVKLPICFDCRKKDRLHRNISNFVIMLLLAAITASFHYEQHIINFLTISSGSVVWRFFKLSLVIIPGGLVLVIYQIVRVRLLSKEWLNLKDIDAVDATPSFRNTEFNEEFRKINNL